MSPAGVWKASVSFPLVVLACTCSCQAETKRHTYGGRLVDRTVNAVFAAFICHTEKLREELTPFGMCAVIIFIYLCGFLPWIHSL